MIRLNAYAAACRTFLFSALLAIAACVSLAPSTSEAAITVPINQNGFNGTFTINEFAAANGQVVALGTLQGTVNKAKKGTLSAVAASVAVPVNLAAPTCPILHLDLGPLNLDVLGLKIDLSEVVLDITAVGGPGNLLGNLLCAVANLLNPNTLDQLNQLVALLNQILNILT
jgi:hypothetical protein